MKRPPLSGHRPVLPLLLAGLWVLAAGPLPAGAQSRINRSAQALARHLGATPPAKAANPQEIAALGRRMTAAIESLEASHRSNGPAPESLLENALDFREDMGDWERLLVMNAVLAAWREAHAMGAFDAKGKFTGRIARGRGAGEPCGYEWIVPGEALPAASNQLANLRLVAQAERRPAGAPLTPRDEAYRDQLSRLIAEKEGRAGLARVEKGPETNAVGQTAAEALARWEKDMAAAGADAQALPNIRLQGDVAATPSHMTKQRWRVACRVTNLSKHPTEVTVEVWLIGITDQKRDHYVMARSSKTLKLRSNESADLDFFSRAEGSYKGKADDHDQLTKPERARSKVRFRGYVARVTHAKGVAAFAGNDQMMTAYGDPGAADSPLSRLPAF